MSQNALSEADRLAIRAAAAWYARLASGNASEADQAAWRNWYGADPLHQRAWQRVEMVRSQMERVPGHIARPTLDSARLSRRQVLSGLLLMASASSLGWYGHRASLWQTWLADQRTATGERREMKLADGSSLTLNTDSAVDVIFTEQYRVLRLLRGEIAVSTAPDSHARPRPFRVETPQGGVLALGTRFSVRLTGETTHVAVLEKAVEVQPLGTPRRQRVQAGEQLDFSRDWIGSTQATDSSTAAWLDGSLIAIDQPLGSLLTELSRYRPGALRWHPSVAGLKVSGSFPINDTDLALAALESGFPLRIVRHTRYWVSVEPRT
ncbi:FecR domain-containing protein [Pseudomonas schmalbachii]|uniref:FecR domain-containing protein n=1 Tax=Pseudomonas schmalbachii TaxID=2816993 RepID=A0ABS3TNA7_9PSED|nr:FecR domain-containing protein [Pseudomonas schmalbachii]MBO3275151.1 FecR domain-containing protein [Pseudomonas schmalbachii]